MTGFIETLLQDLKYAILLTALLELVGRVKYDWKGLQSLLKLKSKQRV